MTYEPSGIGVHLPTPHNIVFYGKAGAGKSTAADYLADDAKFQKISFATALKDVAAQLWGDEARTDRGKLQALGVACRDIDENVWSNIVKNKIDEYAELDDLAEKHPAWVNDDCRFPNEYWMLKERNFIFVRVLADQGTRINRLLKNGKLQDVSQLEHESETALLGLDAVNRGIVDDYTLFNNDDFDDFYKDIENVLRDIATRA